MLRVSTQLLVVILAFGFAQPVLADGRGDWTGYAWKQIDVAECVTQGGLLQCPLYRQKWDWKRNQWVEISVGLDWGGGILHLQQRLTNSDAHDSDFVCVTVLAVDAAGGNLAAHHQNWYMDPGQRMQRSFAYASAALAKLTAIHVGSKQCRNGEGQDDALYARILAEIHF